MASTPIYDLTGGSCERTRGAWAWADIGSSLVWLQPPRDSHGNPTQYGLVGVYDTPGVAELAQMGSY
jgi:hypothetical protein